MVYILYLRWLSAFNVPWIWARLEILSKQNQPEESQYIIGCNSSKCWLLLSPQRFRKHVKTQKCWLGIPNSPVTFHGFSVENRSRWKLPAHRPIGSFYYLDGRVYDPKWFIMAIENLRFAGFFGLTTLDRPTFNMTDIIPVAITTLDWPTIQVLSTYITTLKSYSHSSPANPGCLKSAKITGAESAYTPSSSPAGPPTCCLPLRRPQLLYYMDGRYIWWCLGERKKTRGGWRLGDPFSTTVNKYLYTHTHNCHIII